MISAEIADHGVRILGATWYARDAWQMGGTVVIGGAVAFVAGAINGLLGRLGGREQAVALHAPDYRWSDPEERILPPRNRRLDDLR